MRDDVAVRERTLSRPSVGKSSQFQYCKISLQLLHEACTQFKEIRLAEVDVHIHAIIIIGICVRMYLRVVHVQRRVPNSCAGYSRSPLQSILHIDVSSISDLWP